MKKTIHKPGAAMPVVKKNVSFVEASHKRLQGMTPAGGSFSGSVEKVCDRYQFLIEQHTPEFTPEQWYFIFRYHVEDGRPSQGAGRDSRSLMWDIIDACENSQAPTEFDKASLGKTLLNLPITERVAILDVCERYNAGTWIDTELPDIIATLTGRQP